MTALNSSTAHIDQARALARRGDTVAARNAYKAALTQEGRSASLLTEAGVFEAQAGDAAAAKRLLERALKLAPNDVDVHFNLAELARQAGLLAVAERHYRKVVAVSPPHADAQFGLGECLHLLGRRGDALPVLVRAHELSPQDPDILNYLGIVLEESGHQKDAEQAFRRAMAAQPGHTNAMTNLAALLADNDQAEEADRVFSEISKAALPPAMLGIWADVLLQLRRREEAAALAEDALSQDGRCVTALNVKATMLQRKGAFAEAEAVARTILSIAPDHTTSYQRLATMRRLGADAIPAVKRILNDRSQGTKERATAGFSLYSLLDRQGEYRDAFAALSQANALRASMKPYNADYHDQLADRVIATFDSAFFETRASEGLHEDGPIFILGMPRSGTTLVEQILAAYPEVHAGGERNDLTKIAARMNGYPEFAGLMDSEWAERTGSTLLTAMRSEAPEKRFATNKAPGNYMFIGLIAWLFPRARIVYCKRDPMDNGLSCFEQNFELELTFATDLNAFAHAYRLHERMMAHWMSTSPVSIHQVQYETLVSDPAPFARDLVRYIGLEWNEDCLQTERLERPIDTASVWQVRQPINASSIGKWKRYERELAPLAALLRGNEA
ncbi:tetratricopeptide (TPR) repeat protein [Rhodoligotrophos appendicifer]|uniref:tetratricopeptide repeat-containing sulfotransferase family protein n=1 Tax=Rhodoligotrophos appendicifer TaxID=987056 RepID=UPI0011872EA5|nr:sulfotransferase [Rhodoligotrophos appendicifer]